MIQLSLTLARCQRAPEIRRQLIIIVVYARFALAHTERARAHARHGVCGGKKYTNPLAEINNALENNYMVLEKTRTLACTHYFGSATKQTF